MESNEKPLGRLSLAEYALSFAITALVQFVIIKAIIGLYNMAGAYNGDMSYLVTYAYLAGMGLICIAVVLAIINLIIIAR